MERGDGGAERRVGLFGGSFDPPHRGHVEVARAAADAYALDEILFTPTGRQPLKPGGAVAGYPDRMAMVGLLCPLDPRFRASQLDAPREDGRPNYTVETLQRLRELRPGVDIFGIVGADSFRELPRWYQAERLLLLAEWIVVSRPGFAVEVIEDGGPVHVLETVHEEVSATGLRLRLARGEDCQDAVPDAVLRYVRERGLYR